MRGTTRRRATRAVDEKDGDRRQEGRGGSGAGRRPSCWRRCSRCKAPWRGSRAARRGRRRRRTGTRSTSPSATQSGYGGLGAIGTARMSVNGEVAYCSDPANETPQGGLLHARGRADPRARGLGLARLERREGHVLRAMAGPGFDADYWRGHIGGTDAAGRHFSPGVDWDGSSITSGRVLRLHAHPRGRPHDERRQRGAPANLGELQGWFCWNFLGYTYGNGGGSENPNAVGLAIDTLEVPAGFEIYQLDTGNNSMWHEGARSQDRRDL